MTKLYLKDYQPLIEQGLVKTKESPCENMVLVKYAKKVFYDNLWNKHPLLLHARGHVFRKDTGEQVVYAPTKVFNYGENETGLGIPARQSVTTVEKINGFLANITFLPSGERIITTTGSFDSKYVDLAKKWVDDLKWSELNTFFLTDRSNMTFHFEIVDETDPHIVSNTQGAWLIGCKDGFGGGRIATEYQLDDIADVIGAFRPEWSILTKEEALELARTSKMEGYMIRKEDGAGEAYFKLKSPHYLTKKFLMRMGDKNVDKMFTDPEKFLKTQDEEFYGVIRHIVSGWDVSSWKALTDIDRRKIIEVFWGN